MTAPFVAVETTGPDLQHARAIDPAMRVDPGAKDRQRMYRLDRRSRRLQPLQRLVHQRNMVVVRQHLPFQPAD
ncbi:hypothetical protein NYZ58_18650, partial [Acinetobacter baumannii]|nr:hypothetical protein [Acinetobacter baumannii]